MDADEIKILFRDVTEYNSEFNHSASDSMQLLGLGELPPPASCFICNNGNHEAGYLNFGVWAEYIGNLLICTSCLTKAAEKIGCLAPSVKTLMEKSIVGLQELAQDRIDQLEQATNEINALRTIARSALGNDGITDAVIEASRQATEKSDEIIAEATKSSRRKNRNSDEHATGEGPVHSTDLTAVDAGKSDEPIRL